MTRTEEPKKESCCPRDSLGPATRLYDQDPQGKIVEITPPEGLVGMLPMPCYCTGEPIASASRIVVVFTDVYGVEAGHHKVFADKLAERLSEDGVCPTSVIVPDLFRGVPILQPWMNNDNMAKDIMGSLLGAPGMILRLKRDYPPDKVEADIFHMVLPFIGEQLGLNPADNDNDNTKERETKTNLPKLGCVGFCFGGWVVGRVLGYRQRQVLQFACGVGIHPSFQPNLLHGETTTTMAERIHRPILLLPAWNDVDMRPGTKIVNSIARNQEVEFRKLKASEKKDNQYAPDEDVDLPTVAVDFPTMIHGWVSRGDPADPNIAAEQERALQLTVEFLQKHTVPRSK